MRTKNLSRFMGMLLLASGVMSSSAYAASGIQITEWMYQGGNGEFIELTNFGTTAINFAGWSYDDESRIPGEEDLSAFGSVGVGESVVFTETDAETFRAQWNLSASVKIIGDITNNIGRSDELNIFDASGLLVDRLRYGDNGYVPGSIRTNGVSGRPATEVAIGANNALLWTRSSIGDVEGSYASLGGDIGSPGTTSFAPAAAVPEPETYAMLLAGLGFVGFAARKAKKA